MSYEKSKLLNKIKTMNSSQLIVFGFAGVILLGTFLLMLPVSSASGEATPFLNALFTSTTSVCVTGLVVYDTGTYWSLFGHCIIIILIQIGGLGVITVATFVALLSGKRIGLFQRSIMQEVVAAPQVGGIVRLTGYILKGTFIIELSGAIIMSPVFCRDFGFVKGLWMSFFHSISAFCNAGIDLMGTRGQYSSMTSYISNPLINFTLIGLIIFGGIGFLTWDDIRTNKFAFKRYKLQSKIILLTTGLLIVIPAVIFFFLEFNHMTLKTRILSSLFQAVTPRTAGFNTADLTQMSEAGKTLMIFLMLIGGSPGSTAGGMKTTTFAVLVGCVIAVFHKRDSVQFFNRRVSPEVVFTAATIAFLYIMLPLSGAMLISAIEGIPMLACFFETASAVATVGLSLGLTPGLCGISKIIIIVLMFLGRVGGLTLVYATFGKYKAQVGKVPQEKITVG